MAVWGVRGNKNLTVGPCFQIFSTMHMGQALLGNFLRGSTVTIITPMRQVRTLVIYHFITTFYHIQHRTFYHIQHRLELKYFLFAQFLLIAPSYQPSKSENWELRTDLQDQVMDGWSVKQYNDCLQRQIAQKSSNRKSKLVLSTLTTT